MFLSLFLSTDQEMTAILVRRQRTRQFSPRYDDPGGWLSFFTPTRPAERPTFSVDDVSRLCIAPFLLRTISPTFFLFSPSSLLVFALNELKQGRRHRRRSMMQCAIATNELLKTSVFFSVSSRVHAISPPFLSRF